MHRQNYRLWEQQEVLQEHRRLRSEELFPRLTNHHNRAARAPPLSKPFSQSLVAADGDQQQQQAAFEFQALPKALQLQVAVLLDVSSRCALGQSSRAMLELVCT